MIIKIQHYLLLGFIFLSFKAYPQDGSQDIGEHTVLYSVFNSTFITPEIASIHKLTRAKNKALINIAITDKKNGKTVPATVSGFATNLIQQQKSLDFKTIQETDAVYYIASLRTTEEEVFHFSIDVNIEGSTHLIKFTKKLYVEK